MTNDEMARGATVLVDGVKGDPRFTCATRDPATGDLYLGSEHGVVIVSGGKTHHVKLKGEPMAAGGVGPDGIWFAGPEHLVRFESGKPRTHKLARRDFAIAAGDPTALLVREDALWLGIRALAGESPLYRVELAARRVTSYHGQRKLLSGTVRGLAVFGGRVCALTDTRLVVASEEGGVLSGTHLAPDPRAEGEQRRAAHESQAAGRARKLVDAPYLFHDGGGLIGRDSWGLFVMRAPEGPVLEPWPAAVSLLGTCATRHRGTWLVGTPLGLLAWDGRTLRRLGTRPVVALVSDGARTLVVGRGAVVALEGDLPDAPELDGDVAPALGALAAEACASGGTAARCTALEVLEERVPGDAAATRLVLEALEAGAAAVRAAAIGVVQRRRVTAAQDALVRISEGTDASLRGRAIQALLALGDPRAAAKLVESLRELTAEEARRLIRDLTTASGRPAVDVLRPFVLDDRPVVRRSALLWLGKVGFPQPLLGAIAQLERHQPAEREKGARNLARLRDPLVVYLLAAHLQDASPAVRKAALASLGEVAVDMEIPEEAHALVGRALASAMEREPEDPEVCRAVVMLAERVGHAVPREMVERAIVHAAPEARRAAVQVVERQRRREMVPQLVECLRDFDGQVRGAAVDALGRLGDPRGLGPLEALLRDPLTFKQQLAGEAGHRAVSRAMARILSIDVPFAVEVGDHDAWAAWYRERVTPLLARFGVGRRGP